MDHTTKQPTGDFYAPVNRYKQPGDDKPIFTGTLTKPGDEAKQPFALWAFQYTDKKTGEVKTGYTGGINGVPANIPAADQISALLADATGVDVKVANLTLRPGQIVLFENGFKDEAPNKNRPDQWGWVNPTDGTPPFKVGAWVRQFEDSNRPYLTGQTQYPIPGKSAGEQQMSLDDAIATGKVSRGMPKAKEGRGR
jgi:hypothetical protein